MRERIFKVAILNFIFNLAFLLAAGFAFPFLFHGQLPTTWSPDINPLISILVSTNELPISYLSFIILLVFNFYSLKTVFPSLASRFLVSLLTAYLVTFLVSLLVGLFVSTTSCCWGSPFLMVPEMAFPFPQGFILVGP